MTIAFSRTAKLGARPTRDAELAPRIEGFVVEITEALAAGKPFAEVVRGAAARHPEGAAAFHVDEATLADTFALRDEHTFVRDVTQDLSFVDEATGHGVSVELDRAFGGDLRALVEMIGSGRVSAKRIREALPDPLVELFDELLDLGIVTRASAKAMAGARRGRAWLAPAGVPSVTRLQHASVLYRGRTACVMVDPHVQSAYEPRAVEDGLVRADFDGRVDAIVISHSHADHFHLPTLMSFPPSLPIVVPKVKRPTMLCPDYEDILRMMGFSRVIPLAWNDPPFVVGDLEIHALPFFGEQPLVREAPRHPDLRNQGNTYVIRSPDYASWFLIDSGDDVTGRMADVAADVLRRFGPIDFLLSNLRPFHIVHPRYITGNYAYWMALTPDQMIRFPSMGGECLTLGPRGVAEVCGIVRARHYLPYAHWFGRLGGAPADDETQLLRTLSEELEMTRAETRIIPWCIGDTYLSGRPAEHAVRPFAR